MKRLLRRLRAFLTEREARRYGVAGEPLPPPEDPGTEAWR